MWTSFPLMQPVRRSPGAVLAESGRVEASQPCTAIRATSPAAREVARTMIKVCDAITHAHQRGVIHRDIKPHNILVDAEGEPHVLDFGLAKILDADGATDYSVTFTGQFIGTLAYASPEQVHGAAGDVDVRSDVYSLGVVLYETLSGQLPYEIGDSLASVTGRLATRSMTSSKWRLEVVHEAARPGNSGLHDLRSNRSVGCASH